MSLVEMFCSIRRSFLDWQPEGIIELHVRVDDPAGHRLHEERYFDMDVPAADLGRPVEPKVILERCLQNVLRRLFQDLNLA